MSVPSGYDEELYDSFVSDLTGTPGISCVKQSAGPRWNCSSGTPGPVQSLGWRVSLRDMEQGVLPGVDASRVRSDDCGPRLGPVARRPD
jgi:hypothetical protein